MYIAEGGKINGWHYFQQKKKTHFKLIRLQYAANKDDKAMYRNKYRDYLKLVFKVVLFFPTYVVSKQIVSDT